MDLASLRAQQLELASSVIREDRLRSDPPDLIGGGGRWVRAGGRSDASRDGLTEVPLAGTG